MSRIRFAPVSSRLGLGAHRFVFASLRVWVGMVSGHFGCEAVRLQMWMVRLPVRFGPGSDRFRFASGSDRLGFGLYWFGFGSLQFRIEAVSARFMFEPIRVPTASVRFRLAQDPNRTAVGPFRVRIVSASDCIEPVAVRFRFESDRCRIASGSNRFWLVWGLRFRV